MSTRRGAFVSRCLFLGILLLIVTFVLLAQDDYGRLADTSRVGAELFGALTAVELVAILALTPMATAGCIAGEREAEIGRAHV